MKIFLALPNITLHIKNSTNSWNKNHIKINENLKEYNRIEQRDTKTEILSV